MAQEFAKVATTSEIPPGKLKVVEMGTERVMIVNLDGEYYAVGEECTHAGGLLSEGYFDGYLVECPLHAAVFNVKTGQPESPPADEGLPVYQVKVSGEDILVGRNK